MTREETKTRLIAMKAKFEILLSMRGLEMSDVFDVAIEALSAEPCEDAVSRQAALDAFNLSEKTRKYGGDHSGYDTMMLYEIQDVIEDLPSVTPKQKMGRWIPVSERLPEPFSYVNCTCHSLIDDREDWVVEAFYLPQPPDSPYSDWGNIPMLNWGECEVIAWMYRDIPEPYKAESEDTE